MDDIKIDASHLESEIKRLEQQRKDQEQQIKQNFKTAAQSLSPVNLAKSLFNNTVQDGKKEIKKPKTQQALATTVLSLGAGILAKKLLVGKTKNRGFVKSMLGNGVETVASGFVAKYGIYAQAWITAFIKEFFVKDRKRVKDVTY